MRGAQKKYFFLGFGWIWLDGSRDYGETQVK